MATVALTGAGGGKAADVATITVRVPTTDTARVQRRACISGMSSARWSRRRSFLGHDRAGLWGAPVGIWRYAFAAVVLDGTAPSISRPQRAVHHLAGRTGSPSRRGGASRSSTRLLFNNPGDEPEMDVNDDRHDALRAGARSPGGRLAVNGVHLDRADYRPHAALSRHCRKLAPGMLERAAEERLFRLTEAVMIGDSESDIEVAVLPARPQSCFPRLLMRSSRADDAVANLADAVRLILGDRSRPRPVKSGYP